MWIAGAYVIRLGDGGLVRTSEGILAYILRNGEGGQGSVIVRTCVLLIRVKEGETWVTQRFEGVKALYRTRA